MAYLVGLLSSGKGTWVNMISIIGSRQWEKVFLITNSFGMERFENRFGAEMLCVDFDSPAPTLRDEMAAFLKSRLQDKAGFFDIALNLSSGSGKEHMALLSALLSVGVGIRLVDFDRGSGQLVEL